VLTRKRLRFFSSRVQSGARGARDSGDGRVADQSQETSVGFRVGGVQGARFGAGGEPWWEGVALCGFVGPGGGGHEEAV
jgi:hypothetical protein